MDFQFGQTEAMNRPEQSANTRRIGRESLEWISMKGISLVSITEHTTYNHS